MMFSHCYSIIVKNTLNETICLGLNYHGLHSRSLLRQDFQLDTWSVDYACTSFDCSFSLLLLLLLFFFFSWHEIQTLTSNKQRQITVTIKSGNTSLRTLIYYTDSSNFNRYCLRLLRVFFEHYRQLSSSQSIEYDKHDEQSSSILPSTSYVHGASVPDLRSDGESSSTDRTPPPSSVSSSTYSSNHSPAIWTGSLPNLTVHIPLDSTRKDHSKAKNDVYVTFAENLNRIDEHDVTLSAPKQVPSNRHETFHCR
jgi:hypothetical protein